MESSQDEHRHLIRDEATWSVFLNRMCSPEEIFSYDRFSRTTDRMVRCNRNSSFPTSQPARSYSAVGSITLEAAAGPAHFTPFRGRRQDHTGRFSVTVPRKRPSGRCRRIRLFDLPPSPNRLPHLHFGMQSGQNVILSHPFRRDMLTGRNMPTPWMNTVAVPRMRIPSARHR